MDITSRRRSERALAYALAFEAWAAENTARASRGLMRDPYYAAAAARNRAACEQAFRNACELEARGE